jgi:membrane fusion protein (multidrug efflux system)
MALIAGLTVGASILSIVGFNCWHYLTTHESTDDAYTTGHMHPISARINDTVQRVLVDDNDHVKAGQVLVVLDGRDYKVRVQQALAALNVAKHQAEAARTSISLAASTATGKTTEAAGTVANATASISRALAALAEAKSGVPAAQAALAQRKSEEWRANVDYRRFEQLAQQGAVSFQQRDAALRDVQVAEQARKAAEEAIRQAVARAQQADHAVTEARAMLLQSKGTVEEAKAYAAQTQVSASQYDVAESSITQAQAQLDDAQLQLSYTNITAPVDGRVGKKSVEEGQRVQPGQQLMSVVSDDVWVTANFKETQLEQMRPGQKVSIKMDSFPHKEFTGTVQSFAPGSGASFALLPPDNATGNFTKIVQRIPVKVVFDRESVKGYEELIVPGMSATVSVSVSH